MPPAPSPCTGVCRIDESSGFCIGCLRTLDEIGRWGILDPRARYAVLEQLPTRRQQIPSNAGSSPSSDRIADGVPGKASRG